jgi:hypothetical protein
VRLARNLRRFGARHGPSEQGHFVTSPALREHLDIEPPKSEFLSSSIFLIDV